MNNKDLNINEEHESPYCELCGHCGYIGCCGVTSFIENYVKGKTNCKNEDNIVDELTDMFRVLKEEEALNKILQQENERLKKENYNNKKTNETIKNMIGRYLNTYSFTPTKDYVSLLKKILNKLEGKE